MCVVSCNSEWSIAALLSAQIVYARLTGVTLQKSMMRAEEEGLMKSDIEIRGGKYRVIYRKDVPTVIGDRKGQD